MPVRIEEYLRSVVRELTKIQTEEDLVYKVVGSILDIIKVLTVTNNDVLEAFV